MSAWSDAANAELDRLYGRVPGVGCKGDCADACGPIDAGPAEKLRMRKAGFKLPPRNKALQQMIDADGDYTCGALQDGRCSIYADRPMICRLWAAMKDLRCPYGCEPVDGELVGEAEALALLDAANKVGTPQQPFTAREFADLLRRDPQARQVYRRIIADIQPTATYKPGPR